jgi:hypothetical protein
MSSRERKVFEIDETSCRDIRRGLHGRVLGRKFGLESDGFPFDGSISLLHWMGILYMVVNEVFVRPRYQRFVIVEIETTVLALAKLEGIQRRAVELLFGQLHELLLLHPCLMPGIGMDLLSREQVVEMKREALKTTMRKLMAALAVL